MLGRVAGVAGNARVLAVSLPLLPFTRAPPDLVQMRL
jgi:hypothetical protein